MAPKSNVPLSGRTMTNTPIKPGGSGEPAPPTHLFAEQEDGGKDHEQRGGEADRCRVGQRQPDRCIEAGDDRRNAEPAAQEMAVKMGCAEGVATRLEKDERQDRYKSKEAAEEGNLKAVELLPQ
jgi:hypothetical protein